MLNEADNKVNKPATKRIFRLNINYGYCEVGDRSPLLHKPTMTDSDVLVLLLIIKA